MNKTILMIDERIASFHSILPSKFNNPEMERIFWKKVESSGFVADTAVLGKWPIKKRSAYLP